MSVLTIETAPGYVTERLDKIDLPLTGPLTAIEIHGGNLNYAFCVKDEGGRAVFVKQAPEFIKVFGPEAKLHRERLKLEVEVYGEWAKVLGPEAAARFLPRIYHTDLDNMAVIMEFLGGFEMLEKCLYEGVANEDAAKELGAFMALTHVKTHSSMVSAERAEALTNQFENRILRDIQLQYVFTKAFMEPERSAWLRADAAFMAELEDLRGRYNGKNKDNLSLLHGDLHPGSVMVLRASAEFRIIDPEFCIYGPPGLDIGSLVSGYVLAYVLHSATGNASGACSRLRSCIEQLWATYARTARDGGLAESMVDQIGEDAVAFTACEVARTALGLAGARGLPIEDESLKLKTEDRAVRLAHACIMGRKGKGMNLLLAELDRFGSEASA